MALFLTTTGVSYRLEELIKNAEERLVIISPFLRINERIKELLEDKDRLKIDVRVVYGKNELQPDEHNWLESMRSVRTSYCKNLHAKCYLNEHEALLTSMNLYEFSQVNNHEMGVLIVRAEERDLYEQVHRESMRIVRISDEVRVTVAKVLSKTPARRRSKSVKARSKKRPLHQQPDSGFCIRCREDIATDPDKPYCKRCYRSWNRYKNKDYEEKHCHLCGREQKATLAKPACHACYKKYKDVVAFATGAVSK